MGRDPGRRIVGMVLAVVLLGACSATDGGEDALRGEVLVSAAASLTDAFAAIADAFEAANPGIEVVLNLAGSSTLREQILEGVPADVFASANLPNMERVLEAGAVAGTPAVFARNGLVVAVPRGNPAGVEGLDDLAREDLLVGLCAEGVPCGDFARLALASAGVTASVDTNEPDVRALLTKIEAGELDAGIVYVTDVAAAGDAVEAVAIPERHDVAAEYPIAVLEGAPNPQAASAFVDFVRSDAGRAILADNGFGPP